MAFGDRVQVGDRTLDRLVEHVATAELRAAWRAEAAAAGLDPDQLYYIGQPPSDEDHHVAEVAEPAFESLVVTAGRSRAQVMALDVLDGAESTDEQITANGLRKPSQAVRAVRSDVPETADGDAPREHQRLRRLAWARKAPAPPRSVATSGASGSELPGRAPPRAPADEPPVRTTPNRGMPSQLAMIGAS